MPKTLQEMQDYRAKKAKYMRDYRQHAKNVCDVSSIVNAMIADVFRVGQARDKCRVINHELALDECAEALVSNAVNQSKNEIVALENSIPEQKSPVLVNEIAIQTDVITEVATQANDVISKRQKHAEKMRLCRQRQRDSDLEGFMERQRQRDRAYRQKQKNKV
jgi:GTPase involved in cell partitioning and DNA repair